MNQRTAPASALLRRSDSFLLIVDLQERLVPAVRDRERVIGNALRLIDAAEQLQIPVLATEHCPDRIGPLAEPIRGRVPKDNIIAKTHFSAAAEPGVLERLEALGRYRPVVLGTETHVCVLQTTLGLAVANYAPALAVDAVSSRHPVDHETALRRLSAAGITLMTTEMVVFEWLEHAGGADFRALLPVIKNSPD